ncbi:MAG: putative baseplate assembly protein [Longimicrobiales bacterium]
MISIFRCCSDERRAAIERHGTLNGIDWLEVVDRAAPVAADRQRFLRLNFIKPPGALGVTPANVRIEGGERITNVQAVAATFDGDVLVVEVAEPGDFSPYRLRLVDATNSTLPLAGFDPLLSEIGFSFKVECDSRFDCAPPTVCLPEAMTAPEIDYLARDYPALRQLLLDRLSVIHPSWADRTPADLGVTLVELLAYVGDRLSYQQDAVASEAYIGTARRRVSVRRHARLIDYRMHDGCNARTWVHIEVSANDVQVPAGTQLLTALPRRAERLPPTALADLLTLKPRALVFETKHSARLFVEQNELRFYTWGGTRCCLPRGATRATLVGHRTSLQLMEADEQVLILEEVKGPLSGQPGDADSSHRHAVRLTKVTLGEDPAGGQLHADPAQRTDDPARVTEIEWRVEDALPFPLCISAVEDGVLFENVSVARGNIVLADHGLSVAPQELSPQVPAARSARVTAAVDPCADAPQALVAQRFRPLLPELPVTMAAPYDHEQPPPARATLLQDASAALAAIELRTSSNPLLPAWRPVLDLLAAGATTEAFVVELEDDGSTALRFGDGNHGRRPPAGAVFTAWFRTGTGSAGNIGADAIGHILSTDSGIVSARNPLAAAGGTEPESTERVRAVAPAAFRTQERAVTPEDYGHTAQTAGGVQRARATPRWTGSWRTMVVTVDPEGSDVLQTELRRSVQQRLDRFRMAGQDVKVRRPRYVPLEIALTVCVAADHIKADVERALVTRLGSARLPDGTAGLFHPDNFTFGQPIWLSQVYAAVRSVAGVTSVTVTTFRRQDVTGTVDLLAGRIRLGPLELPRLANDPNFPERGLLRLTMQGGK